MNLIDVVPVVVAAAAGPGGATVVALAALSVVALALTKIPGGGRK